MAFRMLPYTEVHQESSDKLELKQTVHTNSLSGFAVIVARKRLEVKEKPPALFINSELQ